MVNKKLITLLKKRTIIRADGEQGWQKLAAEILEIVKAELPKEVSIKSYDYNTTNQSFRGQN